MFDELIGNRPGLVLLLLFGILASLLYHAFH